MLSDRLFQTLPYPLRTGIRMAFEAYSRPKLTSFYREFIKRGDLVFDVGANMGNYTQIFLDLGAKVIAVEPQPACINVLENKFGSNSNVQIVTKGLASQIGSEILFISEGNHPTSTFSQEFQTKGPFANRSWENSMEVEMTTLDELISIHGLPNFCKVDVEGYETNVLKGLSTALPLISFEYSKKLPEATKQCLALLDRLGRFEYNLTVYPKSILKLKSWCQSHELYDFLTQEKHVIAGDVYARFIK